MSPATNNVKSSNKKEAENNINSSESRHVRRTRGASEIRATPEGRATRSLKRTNGQAQKTAPPNYWACKYNDPNIHTLAGGGFDITTFCTNYLGVKPTARPKVPATCVWSFCAFRATLNPGHGNRYQTACQIPHLQAI